MNLVLIRHSKTIVDPKRSILLWQLSDEGIKKVEELSKKEVIKNLNVIYSSLQNKALETSVLLARNNGIPIKTVADLTEISSFTKKFMGDDFNQKLEDFFEGRVDRLNQGETWQEGLNRFTNGIQEIIEQEKNSQNIGVVSHSCILSFFSAQYCDMKPLKIEKMMQMPDVAVLDWEIKKFINFYNELI